MTKWLTHGLFACCCVLSGTVYAQITPDGSTETTVQTDDFGREVINLAPTQGNEKISLNRYSDFNVTKKGAVLNNRERGARTIINEVTSMRSSKIEGKLRVQGRRANVIIANPNGITINGGEFINMGAVGLTTATVSLKQRLNAFNEQQLNPVLDIKKGEIHIKGDGLVGFVNRLDLMAKSMRIDGVLRNDNDISSSAVFLRAGENRIELDGQLAQSSIGGKWVVEQQTPSEQEPASAIGIEVGHQGLISASRVVVMVTDQGAGVKLGGQTLATANSFTLDAKGVVNVSGSVIAAAQATIKAPSLNVVSNTDKQARIQSQFRHVDLNIENDMLVEGGLIQAAKVDDDDTSGRLAMNVNVGGTLALKHTQQGVRSVIFSQAGTHIKAKTIANSGGRILANKNITLEAQQVDNSLILPYWPTRGQVQTQTKDGTRMWYSAFLDKETHHQKSVKFGEPNTGRQVSEIISTEGNITITAQRITNIGGDMTLNGGSLELTAKTINIAAAAVGESVQTRECGWFLCDHTTRSDVALLGGNIKSSKKVTFNATESITVHGGIVQAIDDVTFHSPSVRMISKPLYNVLKRTKGMRGFFWADESLWIRNDQGGALIANMGKIKFDSGASVSVDGGYISAGGGVDFDGNIITIRKPQKTKLTLDRDVGIFSEIF